MRRSEQLNDIQERRKSEEKLTELAKLEEK